MPPLDPSVILSVVQLLGTIGGAALAVKLQISRLTDGQAEVLRQLGALHKRMDIYGEQIGTMKENHARMDERIKGLKESQQFYRRARLEAAAAGQPAMFADEGDQG